MLKQHKQQIKNFKPAQADSAAKSLYQIRGAIIRIFIGAFPSDGNKEVDQHWQETGKREDLHADELWTQTQRSQLFIYWSLE